MPCHAFPCSKIFLCYSYARMLFPCSSGYWCSCTLNSPPFTPAPFTPAPFTPQGLPVMDHQLLSSPLYLLTLFPRLPPLAPQLLYTSLSPAPFTLAPFTLQGHPVVPVHLVQPVSPIAFLSSVSTHALLLWHRSFYLQVSPSVPHPSLSPFISFHRSFLPTY